MINLEKLIEEGEGERLEFKSSLAQIKDILKTICAFANTYGGIVVVGIKGSGEVVGLNVTDETLLSLRRSIETSIDPQPFVRLRVQSYNDKLILIIEVAEGVNKPYFYRGKCYVRVGSSNKLLSRDEIITLLLEKVSFDSLPFSGDVSIDDYYLKRLIDKARVRRLMNIYFTNVRDVLNRLKLLIDGRVRIAAVLLFSNEASEVFPQAVIKMGVFEDNKIIDEGLARGSLFKQVEEAVAFTLKNLRKGFKIEGIERRDLWEYPEDVLREAIVNAVVHRDYRSTSPTYLKIYPDRIEVLNPGGLPKPLTVDDLRREHPSIPRNPYIARIFYYYGYMEEWGIGTLMMIRRCREEGLPEPEFTDLGHSFKVTLYLKSHTFKILRDEELKLYTILKARGEASVKELAILTGRSERTIHRRLNKLIKLGLAEKISRGRYRAT